MNTQDLAARNRAIDQTLWVILVLNIFVLFVYLYPV